MHLIISEDGDQSTNEICERFYFSNSAFERINIDNHDLKMNSKFSKVYFKLEELNKINVGKTNLSDTDFLFDISYHTVWFRRAYLKLNNIDVQNYIFPKSKKLTDSLIENKKREHFKLFEYFLGRIKSEKKLGSFQISALNKLVVLDLASKFKIKIPKTIICNSKKELISFIDSVKDEVIAKSIYEPILTNDHKLSEYFTSFTILLNGKNLAKIPNNFAPSLIQERIHKEFEIRSFYINGLFYSMAIFSQKNLKTQVDFRHYDFDIPNRSVPFQLPHLIEKKIHKLFKALGLNTGSVDLIKSQKGEFVFLEINPMGQFGMVSYPCNYQLEKKVFEFMIH